MSRAVALSTLRSDVRAKADINSATVRHSASQIDRLINQSIQMFRERISDEGSTHYLESSSGTLGVGPTSPYAFYKLDLSGVSPSLVRVYGIDVTFDGGQVVTLDRVPFESRNDYGTAQQGGIPKAWAPFKTDQIAILPASSSALPYTVWYLPKFTDLSADGDTFDGVAGWEEWVVWDVVAQIAIRDQNPQALQVAEARRVEVEQRVIRGATKVTQAGGAHVGRDSFGGKLTHFLGGSRRTPAVAGGPYVPADGSVTNQMLADMTGPTVKGVMSGTTRPRDVQVATLTTYLGLFNTLQRGLVPPPLSSSSLFLRDDGVWASAGGGAGGSVGPSGAVQYQAGTGMAGASGFRIHGNSPSLLVSLDGSMRVTGGQVEVGSGTVRVSASGVDVGGGSVVNVGTLVASAIAAPAFTDTAAGLAPLSGGGTSNFLRADGVWTAPPAGAGGGPTMLAGGTLGSVQYNGGSGLKGSLAARVRVQEDNSGNGIALAFGTTAPTAVSNGFDINWTSAARIRGLTASGHAQSIVDWRTAGNAGVSSTGATVFYGNTSAAPTGDVALHTFRTQPSGEIHFMLGPSGLNSFARLMPTGLDVSQFHVAARSLTVSSGIPNTELSPMASGTIKAQMGADGIPQDVPIVSITAALYHFSSTTRGVVPLSGGGTSNFLRADGTWDVPPGTGGDASPGGGTSNMQFRDAVGTFGGASGILAVASGTALQLGGPAAASQGFIRGGPTMSVYGQSPALADVRMLGLNASGAVQVGQTGAAVGLAGNVLANTLSLTGSGLDSSNLQPIGSGMIMGRLTGTGTPQNVPFATFMAFAPTFTNARAGVVPPSDGAATSYLAGNGTWSAPSGAHQFPPVAGATNAQLAVMSTGTVKGNLSGNAAPSDVPFATFMAFAPTFTTTRMGVVPASGGGTSNFLRADGVWDIPPGSAGSPGGAIGNIQFNTGASSFGGASGVNIVGSGAALAFGVPSFLPSTGDIRVASGFNITANLPSGIAGVAARQVLFDWSGGGASGVLKVGGASGILGTNRNEVATGGAHEWLIGGQTGMKLTETGLDLSRYHLRVRSVDVDTVNGLPRDFGSLKRFSTNLITNLATGLPSGLSLFAPRGAASGANRLIIPSGAVPAARTITLRPSGARAGEVIRIERHGTENVAVTIATPTGTTLHTMPSGTKSWADFMYTKPSGPNFELAGHADLF